MDLAPIRTHRNSTAASPSCSLGPLFKRADGQSPYLSTNILI